MDSVVPIRDKYVLNTYLLNPIPEKDWIVWIIMLIKPGTCWGVCNTPLPIRDKYLINTYLLNPIPGKDWTVCVGSYCIRPTNAHDYGQMIDPPGTFWGVCNMRLHVPDKYLINMYLLNPIIGKDWIVRVGAYCIRHTNTHDHGQMIDPPGTFWSVCNIPLHIRDKYLINMYLLYQIPGENWIVHVGAYYIRLTNAHDYGQMIDSPGTCLGVCNTPIPIRNKYLINTYLLNLIPGKD